MISLGILGPFQIGIILLLVVGVPLVAVLLLMRALAKNRADTTACPYRGERIMTTARKCKHCGEWLTERG